MSVYLLGEVALWVGLGLALYGAILGHVGGRRGDPRLVDAALGSVYGTATCVAFAYLLLTAGFLNDEFRLAYVAETRLEMAALNVDPGAHRGKPPETFRDKDSFYDPHGAPPYVGVEHDEDDGFRINWNLGSEYDNNQYGRPVGDGKTPRAARLRLERRGPFFAAYYRNDVDARDWVCVGTVRNDSLNPVVYLRCVGKRWRQEKEDDPTQF